MARRIILDTNFLLIPAQFKVDIFSEMRRICSFIYELAVVPETVAELKGITESGRSSLKDKRAANLALQLLKRFKVRVLKNRKLYKRADEAILAIADKNSCVATQDRELKRRLHEKAVSLIILRQKQYLKFF
jgi:uncharacterized protein